MKWPLVFRYRLDDAAREAATWREVAQTRGNALVSAEARAATAERMAEQSAAQFTQLLTKFTALRMQGAQEPTAVPVAIERPEPDKFQRAIALSPAARRFPGMRVAMERQLELDRQAVDLGTMTEAEVLTRIISGVTSDDGVPA